MEFFAEIPARPAATELKQYLSIKNLPALCASIDTVLTDHTDHGRIYCLWGGFDINREEIRNGVRFSLTSCPNALAWTVTADGDLLVHCTINTRAPDNDFVESIELFVQDWAQGLRETFTRD